MSKAEDRALEIYPPKLVTYSDLFGEETLDDNGLKRTIFIEGYRQAEKDLALTWEDIREICRMWIESKTPFGVTGEALSIEVLKRFKAQKGK